MLYVGAIGDRAFLRPDQVTRMTDAQAKRTDDESRVAWAAASLRKGGDIPGRWYAVNTREPIRDETLREGLVRIGAAIVRAGLATTSAAPRYALDHHSCRAGCSTGARQANPRQSAGREVFGLPFRNRRS
jgi:hypothetical protein